MGKLNRDSVSVAHNTPYTALFPLSTPWLTAWLRSGIRPCNRNCLFWTHVEPLSFAFQGRAKRIQARSAYEQRRAERKRTNARFCENTRYVNELTLLVNALAGVSTTHFSLLTFYVTFKSANSRAFNAANSVNGSHTPQTDNPRHFTDKNCHFSKVNRLSLADSKELAVWPAACIYVCVRRVTANQS